MSGSGTTGYNNAYSHTFAYDPAYNPTTYDFWNTTAGADQSYSLTFNFDNQYQSSDFGDNWLYDGSGNPTTYKSQTFTFDPEDRLTGISSPAFSAAYDGDGLRATKTAAGTTTYYLYDGDSPVLEETYSSGSTTIAAVNGMAADGMRSRYDGQSAFDFAYDPQGNLVQRQTVAAYNLGAAAFDETFYEGYGALRQDYYVAAGGGTPAHHDPAGFGGQFGYYTDVETGLLLLGHRYYDPGTGKFINRDPIGYEGGANLYAFCGGNPVNESDPEGTDPPTKGPFGEPISPSDLYTHHPDTNHPNLHYDLKIPKNPLSADPNEIGDRRFRFYPQTNRWEEKQRSRKAAAARRFRAANLAVNAEERILKGSMSKVSKAKFLRTLFASWGRKILRYIPDVPGPLAAFDLIPNWMYNRSAQQVFWENEHPGKKYYKVDKPIL